MVVGDFNEETSRCHFKLEGYFEPMGWKARRIDKGKIKGHK
jgi:hypothetical protein